MTATYILSKNHPLLLSRYTHLACHYSNEGILMSLHPKMRNKRICVIFVVSAIISKLYEM